MIDLSIIRQLILYALAILSCGCFDTEAQLASNIAANQSETEVQIWELVNEHRASSGLASLQLDSTVSSIARQHSANMAEGSVPVGHEGFNDRVNAIRARIGGNSISENVAAGYRSAEAVVEGWLNSSGHRQNIEGSYNLTGVGVAYANDGTPYYTQIFVLR